MARYWSLLDVSIIHLRRTELFTTVIPSKLFECMGMGIPVLHGVEGESAEIVRNEKGRAWCSSPKTRLSSRPTSAACALNPHCFSNFARVAWWLRTTMTVPSLRARC